MFVQEYRASKILYNFLKSNNISGKFILPANVCGIIPLTFYYAGVDFDFFDIQADNFCIDQIRVLNSVNDYSGLLFVRTYGVEDDFASFFQKIKKLNNHFIIIDDSCLCLPCLNQEPLDSIDLKLFSLGYAKQVDMKLGAFGFFSSDYNYRNVEFDKYDPEHYELYESQLKKAISNNESLDVREYYFLENKMFTVDRLLLEKKIISSINQKERLNNIYRKLLPQSIQMESRFQNWRFNILIDNERLKEEILNSLFKNELFASTHYFPISLTWKGQRAPNALSLYNRVVNLFNDFYYSEKQAYETCKIINAVL